MQRRNNGELFINVFFLNSIRPSISSKYTNTVLIKNLLYNLIAFIPMGFLTPIIFFHKNKIIGFLKAFYISISIIINVEVTQLIFCLGSFDIDDIFLNTISFLFGYIIYLIYNKCIVINRRKIKDTV